VGFYFSRPDWYHDREYRNYNFKSRRDPKAPIVNWKHEEVESLPEMPEGLDKNEAREWKKRQAADLRNFKGLVSKMARASELEMPAPRGHFLRDFGQSDRDVIENASDHASVPQALNLLNGPMIEALTNRFAVLGRRLEAAADDDEKIRLIFQAMLTREPTQREMEIARAEIAAQGDDDATDSLVWALLNTQRFLFVQ